MYFYVFFQPDVFEEALTDGEDALQNVVSIPRKIARWSQKRTRYTNGVFNPIALFDPD